MGNLSFVIFICNRFLVSNIFCSFVFVGIIGLMLFGLIYLVGHSLFINTKYVFLSVVPVVIYSDLKVEKKQYLIITKVNPVCIVESIKLMVMHI
jgi:hypothetical protein